ncbi:MAG TPA: hypothetical protein VI382_07345 [Candidatus Manganitrophaceae bacterium]|nr:hypothetical protein [Candidatus Manganitrophaceae bacterium]
MSALYGVICPYCQKKSYVQVPDTPSVDSNSETEATEETPCVVCGNLIIAYTKSTAEWGVRQKK